MCKRIPIAHTGTRVIVVRYNNNNNNCVTYIIRLRIARSSNYIWYPYTRIIIYGCSIGHSGWYIVSLKKKN